MDKMMKIVLEKAFFEKQDVVKLIEMLPIYMQETAVLIAIGRYKSPDVHLTGMYKGKVYTVKEVNPFVGVSVVNLNDYKDTCIINLDIWKQCVLDYQQYQENKQKAYEEKCAEIAKNIFDD
jgi:hypothetical protein